MKTLKLQSLIASFFSIVFSLSIAKQLQGIVSGWVLVLLYIFTILFLIYNEDRKIKEFRRLFYGKTHNIYTIVFTLVISILLSSVGIYLWTNKTLDVEANINNEREQKIMVIEQDYNKQIDNLRNSSINTEEYFQIKKDIEWWKERRPANTEERNDIRQNIIFLQEKLNDVLSVHSKQKNNQIDLLLKQKQQKVYEISTISSGKEKKNVFNNYISFMFITLVFVTEFIIINLQKEIARFYKETDSVEIRIIEDLLNRGMKRICLDDVVYSPFANNLTFEQAKKLFNLLFSLDILQEKEVEKEENKTRIYGVFVQKDRVISTLRDYYFKFNNLKK